jgi:hypothetical protein
MLSNVVAVVEYPEVEELHNNEEGQEDTVVIDAKHWKPVLFIVDRESHSDDK